jgi:DNA-binding beta-propeller fold protein YncE
MNHRALFIGATVFAMSLLAGQAANAQYAFVRSFHTQFPPDAATVDSHGNVWVAVYGGVLEYNNSGQQIQFFGGTGTGDGHFSGALGVAVDSSGNVWASDYQDNRIQEFNNNGTFLRSVSGLYAPGGVAVDPSGNVWVADGGNTRVVEFTSTGSFIQAVGTPGTGNGQFKFPFDVTADSSGNIWVADNNNDIQEFSRSGAFLRNFGSVGSGNGQFSTPIGVAVDSVGNVFVADYGNNRIEELTTDGAFIQAFGSYGSGDGQFNNPVDVALDSSGNVWVADYSNSRVEEFAVVPEPSALALASLGFVALLIARRGLSCATKINCQPPWLRAVGIVVIAGSASLCLAPRMACSQIFVTIPGTGNHDGLIAECNLDGTPKNTSLVTGLNFPQGIVASGGHLFVANFQTSTIGEYDAATGATINASLISGLPGGLTWLAVSDDGAYLFASSPSSGKIGKYTTSGAVVNAAFVSGGFRATDGIAVSGGNLFVVNGNNTNNNTIDEYDAVTGAVVHAALISQLKIAEDVAVSPDGATLFVTDQPSTAIGATIGEYTTAGATVNATLVSGLGGPNGSVFGIKVSGANLFVAINFDNAVGEYTTTGGTVNASLISGLNEPFDIAIVVPEPSGFILGAHGLAGLASYGAFRRQRRRLAGRGPEKIRGK